MPDPIDSEGDDAAERQALIAEANRQKRDAELATRDLEQARAELARVEASVTWRVIRRLRRKVSALLGGPRSRVGSVVERLRGQAERSGGRVVVHRRWRALRLPEFPAPDVSIVIPVHSGAELTERCLRAIAVAGDPVAYEVIVVDDEADPDTKQLLGAVEGIRVVSNARNEGYLLSTNRGAAEARGRHIVLLNNDTEPHPGWLEALVERAESAPDVGIVAAKLVYPNGDLQDAGGIVWRDGSPGNFGNCRSADAPEFDYAREIDYGSAAALLVRSELWRAAGGFDERYAPGYFEDTDLGFTARKLGWRVMYEPRAVVTHVRGGTMGDEPDSTSQRLQDVNGPKFADKWRVELLDQPVGPDPERTYIASNRCRGPIVLVVDHRVPTPDRDSGSLRMWSILEELVDLGCRVVFHPDDHERIEPYGDRLRAMGIEVLDQPVVVPERMAAFGGELALAILSRPSVAARHFHHVREYAPRAVVAYDTVDLHFLRERRRALRAGSDDGRLADGMQELEVALARAADVTLVVSDQERRHLVEVAPGLDVEILPNANVVAEEVPDRQGRSGLVFVGGFEHPPNVDAVRFLVGEVMPIVWRADPAIGLTIVGANAPPEVADLASDRVDVTGWVEDLAPLLDRHLASVAPIRFGAGMKGKVSQSLAAGLPVVATSIGAEGLQAVDGRDLLLADDAAAFADQILRLSADSDLWRQLSASGRELAEQVCSPRVQRELLVRLLDRSAVDRPCATVA